MSSRYRKHAGLYVTTLGTDQPETMESGFQQGLYMFETIPLRTSLGVDGDLVVKRIALVFGLRHVQQPMLHYVTSC